MRNIKTILVGIIVLVCLGLWIVYGLKKEESRAEPTQELSKIGLRVLYIGLPDSSREEDFTQFLKKHFAGVETGDLASFKESQAKGFDVIILDYDGDGFNSPRPSLSSEYKRPTITVGVTGAIICDRMSLKTGYL